MSTSDDGHRILDAPPAEDYAGVVVEVQTEAEPEAQTGCCSPDEQRSCCDDGDKAACCGLVAGEGCGCR